jgi:hypothetical protein
MLVRVKAGRRHNAIEKGVLVTYEGGDTVEVSEFQYKSFKDKFELADGEADPESPKFDVKKASREELLAKAEELGLEVDADAKLKELRSVVGEALDEG